MARHMRNGRDYSRPGPKVDYELRKDSNNAARSGDVYAKLSDLNLHVNLDYSTLRNVVSNVSVTNVKTNVYTVEEDGAVIFSSYIANGAASDGIIVYINDGRVYSQKYKGYFTSGLYPVKVGDVIAVDKDSAITSKLTIQFIGYES